MVGMFFMMTYIKNLMSTDLVTVDKPITIKSYDDIIALKAKSAFARVLPEWEKFSSSPAQSKERKLFDNSVEMKNSLGSLMALAEGHANQKYVLVGRPFVATGLSYALMSLPNYPPDTRIFHGFDMDAKKYSSVIAMNKHLAGSELYQFTYR